MAYRILLVGGGTGGHVFPLVAVARALRNEAQQKNIELRLMMVGEGELIATAARTEHIPFRPILAGKMRRYFSPLILIDIIKSPFGFLQSLWHLFWFMPDLVFAKGGYGSVAPALAARIYGIPLFIHESDSVPGMTTRLLAPFARMTFLSFASSAQHFKDGKTLLTGNPVRVELASADRSAALSHFKLDPNRKTILVIGGSQGAQQINELLLNTLVIMVKDYQIIHQCGPSQYAKVKTEIDRMVQEGQESYGPLISERYRLYPFLDVQELSFAYAVSDVIISRGGANALSEIAFVGKPAIIIPIMESANGHQLANALEFGKAGGVVLEGANVTPHLLLSSLAALLEDSRYMAASTNIRNFATPQAGQNITNVLFTALGNS